MKTPLGPSGCSARPRWFGSLISPGSVRDGVLVAGVILGAVAGVWRLVRVLVRFDEQRRTGR